ncbi:MULTISPECIES: hypothetical protein [unclassified Variovorax]|uniref:hypothetical protein n=1 Tax=unclassified Variovorax TaxID=663243 RepID=UPI000AD20655|nr:MULTISPECIES: hypothetical protein [unclassified Variovorax]PNG56492.1 hypothetical protein CHC07_02909 [Variovorax sp. B4]PNG57915.1 hypothetical protein CHC06_02911 [Variovorax sp. B2]VTV09622.1 hypothetical protein WDL1CHR_00715 [Variovorax sp. WDL1]
MSALTLAPVSPKAAELLHALYAEALAQAEPAPGTALLPPTGALKASSACDGTYLSAYCATSFRNSITLFQNHARERQAKWAGEEVRYDTDGRRWERAICGVINDFGDLVEVPR